MATSGSDNNMTSTMTGVLNTDGVTITPLKISPTSNVLDINDGVSGSDFGKDDAERDQNGEPVSIVASSSDGTTPVPLYVDSSGCLLIKST